MNSINMQKGYLRKSSQSWFACFAFTVGDWKTWVDVCWRRRVPLSSSTVVHPVQTGRYVLSSLAETCQTMRWLRSASARKGCSFMGASSASSASPPSSPADTQGHVDPNCPLDLVLLCLCSRWWTHPFWSRCSLLLRSSPTWTCFLPE